MTKQALLTNIALGSCSWLFVCALVFLLGQRPPLYAASPRNTSASESAEQTEDEAAGPLQYTERDLRPYAIICKFGRIYLLHPDYIVQTQNLNTHACGFAISHTAGLTRAIERAMFPHDFTVIRAQTNECLWEVRLNSAAGGADLWGASNEAYWYIHLLKYAREHDQVLVFSIYEDSIFVYQLAAQLAADAGVRSHIALLWSDAPIVLNLKHPVTSVTSSNIASFVSFLTGERKMLSGATVRRIRKIRTALQREIVPVVVGIQANAPYSPTPLTYFEGRERVSAYVRGRAFSLEEEDLRKVGLERTHNDIGEWKRLADWALGDRSSRYIRVFLYGFSKEGVLFVQALARAGVDILYVFADPRWYSSTLSGLPRSEFVNPEQAEP